MKKGIIGRKVGMTQIFDEKGNVIPVTVIEAGPCVVAQVKTVETDGYDAIQLGFGEVKDKHINKPEKGHFAKAGLEAKKHLREFRLESVEGVKVGDEVKADVFEAGEKVDVGTDFFGLIMGDMSRIGANSTTLPGSFIGSYTWVLPTCQIRGFVPSETRVFSTAGTRYEENPKQRALRYEHSCCKYERNLYPCIFTECYIYN